MKNSKKKKIIMISSIVLGIALISLLLVLFFLLDTFKSPQQLFYKYLPQNKQLIEVFSSDLKPSYDQKMKQNSYTSDAEASLVYEMGNQETEGNELYKLVLEGKVDNTNQKQYNKVTITKNNQELLSATYIENDTIHALLLKDVVAKYLAIDDNYVGLLDKTYAILPNIVSSIMQNNELINTQVEGSNQVSKIIGENGIITKIATKGIGFTEEEKEVISTKYTNVVVENIDKSKFSKTKSMDITIDGQKYKAKEYLLDITSGQIKGLIINILQQLQNDEETINILINKYYSSDTQTITRDELKLQIQELEQVVNQQQIQDIQIQISLCVSDGKLLKTEVAIGEKLITIQYINSTNENRVIIKDESSNKEENQQYDILELKKSENEEQYVVSALLSSSSNPQNTISLQISRVGNVNSNIIKNLKVLTVKSENDTYTLRYSNNINYEKDIQIEELKQEDYVMLNTYSQEELQQLIIAIIQRVNQVWNENLAKIGMNGQNVGSLENPTAQLTEEEQPTELTATEKLAIEMFNEQFLAYLGEKVSADNVKNLLKVTKTAIQNQNPIKIKYSGKYNNTDINKEVTTTEEIDALEIYIVNGKNYFVQGTADTTGKLTELEIKENIENT